VRNLSQFLKLKNYSLLPVKGLFSFLSSSLKERAFYSGIKNQHPMLSQFAPQSNCCEAFQSLP
jgi:hypothetical protein